MGNNKLIQLKDSLVGALSKHGSVEEIALFGSLVKGDVDQYSDIDMIVAISSPINGLEALGHFGEVRYYRSFSSVKFPSGRYWMKGYSVFNKIDISFHTLDEFEKIVLHGDPEGYTTPPFNIEWKANRVTSAKSISTNIDMASPYIFSEAEDKIGKLVYRLSRSLKSVYRNESPEHDPHDVYSELSSLWAIHSNSKWVGGALDSLVTEILSLGSESDTVVLHNVTPLNKYE